MIPPRNVLLKIEREITIFRQLKRLNKIDSETRRLQGNGEGTLEASSARNRHRDSKVYLTSSKISKDNSRVSALHLKGKKDARWEDSNANYTNIHTQIHTHGDKRNVTSQNEGERYNNRILSSRLQNIRDSNPPSGKGSQWPLPRNDQSGSTPTHGNGNPNLYINKLHDYLDIAQKSENEKIKINKILNRLRNENLTIHTILEVLKSLCIILLKRTPHNLDNLIPVDYLNTKNAVKKYNSYFEEYFTHVERYIQNYICLINERNIFDLFKYMYYLNYALNLEVIELLLEKFYLHMEKLDNLKTVQIFYMVQSFYKHFYSKEVDSYLTLIVDDKISTTYNDELVRGKPTYWSHPSQDNKYTFGDLFGESSSKWTLGSNTSGLFTSGSQERNDDFLRRETPPLWREELKGEHNDGEITNFVSPNNARVNERRIGESLFFKSPGSGNPMEVATSIQGQEFGDSSKHMNDPTAKRRKNIEEDEILTIFKYMENFHHKMNFYYTDKVMTFLKKNRNELSTDTLLCVANIYLNGADENMSRNLTQVLHDRVDHMNEDQLVRLADYLKRAKNVESIIIEGVMVRDKKDGNQDIPLVSKILQKIKKDNELITPNNLAAVYLNMHEVFNKLLPSSVNITYGKDDPLQRQMKKKESNQDPREDGTLDTVADRENIPTMANMSIGDDKKGLVMTTGGVLEKNSLTQEMIKFCDNYVNSITHFPSVLSLYLLYIKNDAIKNKTIQAFEKKIKMNKHKLTQENISNIILSLSIYPYHTTQMFTYLENVIGEKLMSGGGRADEAGVISSGEETTGVATPVVATTGVGATVENDVNYSKHPMYVDANYLIDISLAFGIAGRKNLNLWKFIDVRKIVLTCNKKLLLYLSYSFLLTNYVCPVSWFFLIKRIVDDVRAFNKKQYELLYEILKCAMMFNYIDLNNFSNGNSFGYVDRWKGNQLLEDNSFNSYNNKNSNSPSHFIKTFQYLLNSSYFHYKMKLINNQYISKVPYEEVFNYLKLKYEKNVEFKQLYIMPYLLTDYNVIIDPLPSTPIHRCSGYIMGEIQLKHKVFQCDNYVVLSFYDGMWDEFLKASHTGGEVAYDIKALAEHFKTYTESHIKIKINKAPTARADVGMHNSGGTNAPFAIDNKNKAGGPPPGVHYLKYIKKDSTQEQRNKYLTHKPNSMSSNQDQNKYLKIKTKVGRKAP
ncbi:conserved Plasmodium protein, unknown function [Plasmodium knowlesi strain H]|uniref:Uncharacterized protein n=3 Tax=Plasmodium knowlesi TaxID=5850 RepID=A0A5K1V4B8_PLAKH|nr:conserved protein, unknown function [Plasmodium knowlesi strain H]OTN63899.1 Uncharacterized protein PKNOH_S140232400 [Plasmodium knowlesi]CAA9990746.1 conserved protein, unknown function [Plasmodium knowlesi strain H]SBO21166.1 conserved Plasmodium protein, unknown function [Plasmodium knowlesi strain H]SBO21624.1 conserved Plasmodium protein, unknown function [Plasmodium knowlesi strain H]VVS80220.1 conserved protein, unknown function [Plasmodium knowlesi strain H]|eukprot:XP_002262035.1 hypothetical protein, conserved [Plasmodium knowlesi strain H]